MEDYEVDTNKLLSDFNEAKFQIYRLHNIWEECNRLSCSGKLEQWNWKLDAACRELSKDITDEDKTEESTDEKSYYQKLLRIDEDITDKWKQRTKLYQLLNKKERILREIQDVSGKGGKKRLKDEDLMD